MKNAGIFLSGTGNTRHCLELLLNIYDPDAPVLPLESTDATEAAAEAQTIFLAYPTQFSDAPKMVHDWIQEYAHLWRGKKVFLLATMGLFSGDATGCAARPLRKLGSEIVGGLQVKMPDPVCDSRLLKRSRSDNLKIIQDADAKIERKAARMQRGRFPREGLSAFAHLAGLLGQRLWYRSRTTEYAQKLSISAACAGCGQCIRLCPMHNLHLQEGRAESDGLCTMCYRCISLCPKKAITLIIGSEVVVQHRFENYQDQ